MKGKHGGREGNQKRIKGPMGMNAIKWAKEFWISKETLESSPSLLLSASALSPWDHWSPGVCGSENEEHPISPPTWVYLLGEHYFA